MPGQQQDDDPVGLAPPGVPGHDQPDDVPYDEDWEVEYRTTCEVCGEAVGVVHGRDLEFCATCCEGLADERVLGDGCYECDREPLDAFRLAMHRAITADLMTTELPIE